ncbi:MAG: bacteriocin immunity protein [Streptococcaceae bacterium]|jgi:uncharacterized protein Yka (UPF0111/DUF47 family)|nr:bacteriocin immunity protein [Streptococcaceae bacterium]
MVNNKKIEALEQNILEEIYNLVLSTDITPFEREKMLSAKFLIEKKESYLVVLRRIQITFISKSLKGEMSPEFKAFYKKIPEWIQLESEGQAAFAAGAFLAPPIPL